VNDRHGKKKDTLLNVEATRQFVVNIATEANAEKMNQTSAAYPYGVSEFEKAGLTPVASSVVKPPRVAESPAAYECELVQIVRLGEGPLSGNLIIGKVVQIHVDEAIYNGGKIRHSDLKTIGRMEGAWYSRTQDAFELPRPEAA
jgi:flavin reductase (DIM6/NTAB) family NADH-FMN oxidoreductase RutF